MTDGRQPAGGAGDDQGGVFGNLPGSRPGFRSPRRGSGKAAAAEPAATRRRRRQPTRAPKREPAPPRSEREPADVAPETEPGAAQAGGIEDLAWAGVAVAAEAATVGVRLASRAIEALRGSSEKS
jgi:hypothetical protein